MAELQIFKRGNNIEVTWNKDTLVIENQKDNINSILDISLLLTIKEKCGEILMEVIVVDKEVILIKANIVFSNFDVNSEILEYVVFEEHVSFWQCRFIKMVFFSNKKVFKGETSFKEVTFEQEVHFWDVTFKQEAYFNESIFEQEAYFRSTTFKEQAYFRNVTFKKNSFFDSSKFEGAVQFSFSIFEKLFQFVGAQFEKPQQVYFTGVKYSFTKDNIKTYIENQRRNNISTSQEYRESFRLIKSILISQNNSLDALQANKIELYCKEVELEFKEPNPFSREWIDRYQLWFYRTLSDHHTDLGRVFSMLIMLIGLFGIFSFFIFYLMMKYFGINLLEFEHIPISTMLCYKEHLKNWIPNNWRLFIGINLGIILLFIAVYLCFANLYNYKNKIIIRIRCSLLFICLLITFGILVSYPKYLFPPLELFKDVESIFFDPLSILGSVYTFMFGVVVYSFSRTARRSSLLSS